MNNVAYIYPKRIAKDEIATFLDVLSTQGVMLTHLGKNDPPAKWSGDATLATEIILSGQDLTLWTFFRAIKLKIEGEIQIHRDPRWPSERGVRKSRLSRRLDERSISPLEFYII